MNQGQTVIVNGSVGLTGSIAAWLLEHQTAALFAGYATGCWMLWQLGVSVYDRVKRRQNADIDAE